MHATGDGQPWGVDQIEAISALFDISRRESGVELAKRDILGKAKWRCVFFVVM